MSDANLSRRLRFAEADFLTALENDAELLTSYHRTWSTLSDDLFSVLAKRTVDIDFTHLVASRVSNIASCYLNVKLEEERFALQLHIDCDAILHQTNVPSLDTQVKSLDSDSAPHTPILNEESPSSPLVSPAYRWLLDNLHNPYPNAEIKTRIAAATSCQVSSVKSWFINARRRIGWTTLCRERFSNCRADMIDAAYRALVEEDPQRILSPDLTHSFLAIRVAAEDLYPSTFTRSSSTEDLDVAIKGIKAEREKFVETGKCCQIERSITKPRLVYSVVDESKEDILLPITTRSKRSWSSVELADKSATLRRPIKRLRASTTPQTDLPFPSGMNDVDIPPDNGPLESSPLHSTQSEPKRVPPSCKRRLSDANNPGTPKRPHGFMVDPHLLSVSNPLPSLNLESEPQHSIDDWFNTNFDALFTIPPPADFIEPGASSSWEVELFGDYSIAGNSRCTPKCPPAFADTHTLEGDDPSKLDGLMRSVTSDFFATSSEGGVLTSNPCMSSLGSSVPDMSTDWTSILSTPDTYQTHIHSMSSQYLADAQALPEVDLSILQLPHAIPPVDSLVDSASRQAKLHQLHVMQEAIRWMEQELESESVIMRAELM